MINFNDTPVAFLTFIAFLGLSLYGLLRDYTLIDRLVFKPYDFFHRKKYFNIISSGFVHADFPHLIFNGLTFFFFAFTVEKEFGSFIFFVIYYGCLIIAHLPSLFRYRNYEKYGSLGASGAIAGVLFSFILLLPKENLSLLIIPFIPIPAFIFGLIYLAWEQYSSRSQDGINHEAHIWGAISGLAITIALVPGIIPHFWNQIIG